MYAQRRDLDEPGIIEAYRRIGAYAQPMDKSAGFDLLVAFRGVLYVVEVKSTGGKKKSREQLERMLTENEYLTMQLIQAAGGEYHIVTDAAAALAAVGIGE